ncbi:ribosome maturation factor RimM [Plebeiibacterium sediminum]|uniref:Ribosome maturation factor RimM n=1 Tax=Plebeiibacterium sediminum TaxID=2992112 RepID=A0AAE3SD89_9BACT|nr:ribosome maturation factor RimM [Plebeiobacterium sediminum]MCW3784993.1 ribosome maturation factor RimM [Plebeiobacterium sediminum]
MIIKEQCVKVGFVSKPHGVKGEISVSLFDGFYSEDFDSEFLLLDIDNGLVPFYIESLRIKGSKTLLIKLEDVETEDKAREFSGTEVYTESVNISVKDDFQTVAFVGFTVVDQEKGDIGVITGINEISNNPLFIIDCDGDEILIPINPDFIIAVDEQEKTIAVDLPEGLVDLYINDEDGDEDDF